MSDRPKKRKWSRWFWALPCVLLAIYVGGYFRLAEYQSFDGTPVSRVRIYRWNWIRRAYLPLARIDAHINHRIIWLKTPDDNDGDWIIIDPDD
jgi:hypothetical protein